MKTEWILVALVMTIFSGCSKDDKTKEMAVDMDGIKEYLIKKGNHNAEENELQILNTAELNFEVKFDSSAVYQSVTAGNQEDVNKLIGFSDCNAFHHDNSARFGWAWNGKVIVLYAYTYFNKERVIKPLVYLPLYQPLQCSLKATGDKYYFTTGAYTDSLSRYCAEYSGSRYKLYPYFGGDETAPHDIRIKISEN